MNDDLRFLMLMMKKADENLWDEGEMTLISLYVSF